MNRCSFCEWIPILPMPVWPLAGQFPLGQNVVVGSMTLLLAVRGKHCHEKYVWTPVFFTTAPHHGLVWSYRPQCQSPQFKKNGHMHNGKQNHHCHDCGRQFVQCCEQYLIAEDKRGLIERLLVERISLRGICRAVGVTLKWLLGFLVQCFEALPDHLHV